MILNLLKKYFSRLFSIDASSVGGALSVAFVVTLVGLIWKVVPSVFPGDHLKDARACLSKFDAEESDSLFSIVLSDFAGRTKSAELTEVASQEITRGLDIIDLPIDLIEVDCQIQATSGNYEKNIGDAVELADFALERLEGDIFIWGRVYGESGDLDLFVRHSRAPGIFLGEYRITGIAPGDQSNFIRDISQFLAYSLLDQTAHGPLALSANLESRFEMLLPGLESLAKSSVFEDCNPTYGAILYAFAHSGMHVGENHHDIDILEESVDFHQRAIEVSTCAHDEGGLSSAYQGLGNSFRLLWNRTGDDSHLTNSVSAFENAEQQKEALGDEYGVLSNRISRYSTQLMIPSNASIFKDKSLSSLIDALNDLDKLNNDRFINDLIIIAQHYSAFHFQSDGHDIELRDYLIEKLAREIEDDGIASDIRIVASTSLGELYMYKGDHRSTEAVLSKVGLGDTSTLSPSLILKLANALGRSRVFVAWETADTEKLRNSVFEWDALVSGQERNASSAVFRTASLNLAMFAFQSGQIYLEPDLILVAENVLGRVLGRHATGMANEVFIDTMINQCSSRVVREMIEIILADRASEASFRKADTDFQSCLDAAKSKIHELGLIEPDWYSDFYLLRDQTQTLEEYAAKSGRWGFFTP